MYKIVSDFTQAYVDLSVQKTMAAHVKAQDIVRVLCGSLAIDHAYKNYKPVVSASFHL